MLSLGVRTLILYIPIQQKFDYLVYNALAFRGIVSIKK